MRRNSLFAVFALFLVVLSGCGISSTTSDDNPCSKYDPTIGFVSDTGGIKDKSFNQGTWEAIQDYCKNNSVGATYKEAQVETDYIPNIKAMSETDGIKVVVTAGSTLANAVYEVAKDHPDTKYISIDAEPQDADGNVKKLDNVKTFLFNEQEAGYLVGYIAGKETQSNKVGFIGGMEIPPVQKFGFGYLQGVAAANPDAQVTYQYSGTFSDTSKGSEMATAMYNSGVDIIFSAAGGVNDGVINAAKTLVQQSKVAWVIGVDRDMYEQGKYGDDKSVVLTSATKNLAEAVTQGLTDYKNNTFTGGTEVLGYKDDGVGLPAENPNLTTGEGPTAISEAKAKLEKTTVASTSEDTKKAIGNLKVDGKY